MRSRSGHLATLLLVSLIVSTASLSACGDAADRSAAPAAESAIAQPTATETPWLGTSETQSADPGEDGAFGSGDSYPEDVSRVVDPSDMIGQTVRDAAELSEICAREFGFSNDDEYLDYEDSYGSSSISSKQLLPGGRVVLHCDAGQVVSDVFTGRVTWSRAANDATSDGADGNFVTSKEVIYVGPHHVYVVSTMRHPAVDLEAAYYSREVAAFDVDSGESSWVAPLEEAIPRAERTETDIEVVESPLSSGTDIVVIKANQYSAFQATTGQPLWSAAEVQGNYLGLGISLQTDTSAYDDVKVWTAYDSGKDKKLWSKAVPDISASNGTTQLQGKVLWQFGSAGVIAVDLTTGDLLLNRLYPKTWSGNSFLVTSSYSLADDGTNLQMFRTDNLRKPLWSQPSDGSRPVALTRDIAVVKAASGELVALDGRTGEIMDQNQFAEESTDPWEVVDGLTFLSDGSIFQLSPPSERPARSPSASQKPGSVPQSPVSSAPGSSQSLDPAEL